MSRAFFGVEGLDTIVSQGLSYGSQILVQGDTGVGKTVLAGEFIKEGLICGDTCIYVACDEAPSVMREHLTMFKLSTKAYEETGRLIFVDAYEQDDSPELYSISDHGNLDKYFTLEKKILSKNLGGRVRLIVDSMSTLLTGLDSNQIINFHKNRLKFLRKHGVLTMDVFVKDILESQVMTAISHLYNVIVRMTLGGSPARPVRILQLGKLKSGKFSANQYMFTIHPVFGIVVALDLEVIA
ncbi:MAG: ATPase [Firmicutes bacterium]|nr:ATPase [Bacillota bacterium]